MHGFEIIGPDWLVERTCTWTARRRWLSEDNAIRVQTSKELITILAWALTRQRIAPS